MLSIFIFIFFAIISGLIQITYVIIQTNEGLNGAINLLKKNEFFGLEVASILGSYFSIIIILVIIEYYYKESIYNYLKITKPPIYKTLEYILIFIYWIFAIGYIAEKFKLAPLNEGGDFALSLLTSETNLLLLFLAIGVIQPIFEEILFRGFLFTHFERKWGAKISIIVTAIIFTIVHFQYNFMILGLVLFPMAILLGVSRWKTNSLIPAIIIHCVNNSLTLAVTLLY